MKKSIKLSVKPIGPDFQTVEVGIVEQSHRGVDFGLRGYEFTHGGVCLRSEGSLALYGATLFVRGTRRDLDHRTVSMPVDTYAKIKAAVEAYNALFSFEPHHIKISGTPVGPDFQFVDVQVLEQTHRNKSFTEDARAFKASNGFVLKSGSYPDYYYPDSAIYLRGEEVCNDNRIVRVPAATFKLLKDAVEEYNKVYSAPKKCAAPAKAPAAPVEACAVVIG